MCLVFWVLELQGFTLAVGQNDLGALNGTEVQSRRVFSYVPRDGDHCPEREVLGRKTQEQKIPGHSPS